MVKNIKIDQDSLTDSELLVLYRIRKNLLQKQLASKFGLSRLAIKRRECNEADVEPHIIRAIKDEEDFSQLTSEEYFQLLRKRHKLSVTDLSKKLCVSRQQLHLTAKHGSAIDKYLGLLQSAV